MRSYKTEGIILRRRRFGEADLILTVFSKHKGKISVLAKGVRKPTSRKGGNLELFNLVKMAISCGRNLDLVTEAEAIDSFKVWKNDLKKVAHAYHYCELVDRLSPEAVPNRKIFSFLRESLRALSGENLGEVSKEFGLKLLEELGFWPKGKLVGSFDLEDYIENLVERKLKSRKFLQEVKTL